MLDTLMAGPEQLPLPRAAVQWHHHHGIHLRKSGLARGMEQLRPQEQQAALGSARGARARCQRTISRSVTRCGSCPKRPRTSESRQPHPSKGCSTGGVLSMTSHAERPSLDGKGAWSMELRPWLPMVGCHAPVVAASCWSQCRLMSAAKSRGSKMSSHPRSLMAKIHGSKMSYHPRSLMAKSRGSKMSSRPRPLPPPPTRRKWSCEGPAWRRECLDLCSGMRVLEPCAAACADVCAWTYVLACV